MNRVLICDSLLKRNEAEPFLKRLITGDDKCIYYLRQERVKKIMVKRQANSIDKPRLTHNKLMLCICWNWKGIVHYELLPPGKTINSDLYCQQLMRHEQEVEKKRRQLINKKSVIFHYDNARPHTPLEPLNKHKESLVGKC
ncbi:Histone-lysine N-methyltransferase SETMAR [Eumeta japonica]|uniref:Histone-lysine N-methyltransferase SETMAR n=1 Tax=Eumeta variegata TaxID=151549 RepID=A0A4C1VPE1_EUMVA|nr:Histone-lysine N-methyltransferase SETMAR [Eumeta japonica]